MLEQKPSTKGESLYRGHHNFSINYLQIVAKNHLVFYYPVFAGKA